MKIGILRETKIPVDTRVPLTPRQCMALQAEYPEIRVFVQPSPVRCYTDADYEKEGVELKEDLSECDVLFGIKEVAVQSLMEDKTYLFFSHTIKKQAHNKKLLRAILDKRIRLIDFEMLTDKKGTRIIGFGRWAGLIGTYLGFGAYLFKRGISNLPLPAEFHSLEEMMKAASLAPVPPLRIALTGDGRVAGGAEEMMAAFGVQKITLGDYLDGKEQDKPVYVQLDPAKYNSPKSKGSFDLLHFFSAPAEYESNFYRFCDKTDLLVMAAYWDPSAPLLFTMQQLREKKFRISVIADISCDLNGSIPCTVKTTTLQEPFYDYVPATGEIVMPFSAMENITVMSVDNLPTGLPGEASNDFGNRIIKSIIPLFFNDSEKMLERATIANNGKLTCDYEYLSGWVYMQD